MISYSAINVFTCVELAQLKRVTKMVESVDEEKLGATVRCHELARAVGTLLKLPVQDGLYRAVSHSWLLTSGGHILDVYCIGRLPQVQLVDPHLDFSYVPKDLTVVNPVDEQLIQVLIKQLRPSGFSLSRTH